MIKTQVQIPDHLYREAKRVAADWQPPKPLDLGATLAPEEEWTALSHE